MKKVFKILFLILFFLFGLGLAFVRAQKKVQSKNSTTMSDQSSIEEVSWPEYRAYDLEADLSAFDDNVNGQTGSSKFVIVQTQAMTTDKTKAQTGEEVRFMTKIKNQGTEMKHLTHVCFNHSGGVTFGCLEGPQGPNLDPGKEMEIANTTVFTAPGTYYIWLTWSQDETNFYQPQGSNSVKVVIE